MYVYETHLYLREAEKQMFYLYITFHAMRLCKNIKSEKIKFISAVLQFTLQIFIPMRDF